VSSVSSFFFGLTTSTMLVVASTLLFAQQVSLSFVRRSNDDARP